MSDCSNKILPDMIDPLIYQASLLLLSFKHFGVTIVHWLDPFNVKFSAGNYKSAGLGNHNEVRRKNLLITMSTKRDPRMIYWITPFLVSFLSLSDRLHYATALWPAVTTF